MLAQTGMPAQGVFLATIIGAVAGTLMMAFMPTYHTLKRLVWGLMPSSLYSGLSFGLTLGKRP